MSVLTPPTSFGFPPLPVRKFSVDEYHQMIDSGILKEDDRVELLEGWIVPKMVHTNPGGDANPTFADRQDFGMPDAIPLVLDAKEIARMPVRELLP